MFHKIIMLLFYVSMETLYIHSLTEQIIKDFFYRDIEEKQSMINYQKSCK